VIGRIGTVRKALVFEEFFESDDGFVSSFDGGVDSPSDAGVSLGRAADKVALDEGAVGHGIHSELESVAIHADIAKHLLVGCEIRVLVVIDEEVVVVFFARKMTSGARDA